MVSSAIETNRAATDQIQTTLTEAQAQALAARSALNLLDGHDPSCPTSARPFHGDELERAVAAQNNSLTLAQDRISAARAASAGSMTRRGTWPSSNPASHDSASRSLSQTVCDRPRTPMPPSRQRRTRFSGTTSSPAESPANTTRSSPGSTTTRSSRLLTQRSASRLAPRGRNPSRGRRVRPAPPNDSPTTTSSRCPNRFAGAGRRCSGRTG